MTPKIEIGGFERSFLIINFMDQKIDTFCQVDTRVLAVLGIEKIRFVDFYEDFFD